MSVNSTATHHLAHNRIKGETISIVDILVCGQPPEHRLPEQAVTPMDRILAASGLVQCN